MFSRAEIYFCHYVILDQIILDNMVDHKHFFKDCCFSDLELLS